MDPCRRKSPRENKVKSRMFEEPETTPRAEWSPAVKKLFLEAAHDEIVNCNFSKGTLVRQGWRNVSRVLTVQLERPYKVPQLKNQWPKLKREWEIVKNLLRRLTGAGLDEATGFIRQEPQWWMETIAANSRMSAYGNMDMRTGRDLGQTLFDGSLATGEFAIAPSIFSNAFQEGNADMDDSELDSGEGSGDSGDKSSLPPSTFLHFPSYGGSSGSSGKRKAVGLSNCMIPQVRRKLPASDYSMGSAQTTGTSKSRKNEQQAERVPTVQECMAKINYLESENLELYGKALALIRVDLNRMILGGIPSRRSIEYFITNTKPPGEE